MPRPPATPGALAAAVVGCGLLLLPGTAAPVDAQLSPFALEASAGAAMPVGAFRQGPLQGGDIGPGPSLGIHFNLTLGGTRVVSVGFRQLRFGCADDGCPDGGTYVSTDWDLGARLLLGSGVWIPWVGGGAIFTRVERTFTAGTGGEGPDDALSDLSLGGELGAGVTVSVGGRFSLDPRVRWVALDTRFPERHLLRMRYVAAELGVLLAF